ncbi:MAG: amidohydrolase family protein [Pseudobdellovibrionaceae bacterium]
MKRFHYLIDISVLWMLLLASVPTAAQTASNPELIVIGNIPGQYLKATGAFRPDKKQVYFGSVRMKERLITEIRQLNAQNFLSFVTEHRRAGIKVLILNSSENIQDLEKINFTRLEQTSDVIYPGLINLHNHTKQNNLPVWGQAEGQFVNRFEWKDFETYKKSVSFNINPWVSFGPAAECATYRWSELQAMVGGTAYLQGPSSCVSAFGILRVEEPSSYVSKKDRVSAPTDLILPEDFGIVWSHLRPLIKSGQSYEQALVSTIHRFCSGLKDKINVGNINTDALTLLADQNNLKTQCVTQEPLPKGFLRFISFSANHAAIAGRKKYLSNPLRSALIVHLSEGRSDDPYNQIEYEIFELLGLTKSLVANSKRKVPVVLVHGIGIPKEKYGELAALGIGLVWSPFSNMILYNETLDVDAAKKAGIVISIGSDWLPTGTRHVLEEVKFAKQYLKKENLFSETAGFTDETLYQMITQNPAQQIDHYELKIEAGKVVEAPVGRLMEGAMASVISVKKTNSNPFTNLIEASEREINLNVIDGKPVYGNQNYIEQYGNLAYEVLEVDSEEYTFLKDQNIPKPPMDQKRVTKDVALLLEHLSTLGKLVKTKEFQAQRSCQFEHPKVFVNQNSLGPGADRQTYGSIITFMSETGLNLDRARDIAKILAINLLTQTRNRLEADGDPSFALQKFSPVYSCNDNVHQAKLKYYFDQVVGNRAGEFLRNRQNRSRIRQEQRLNGTTDLYNLYK